MDQEVENTEVEDATEVTENTEEQSKVVENIPKTRFDEVIQQRNQYKEQLTNLDAIQEENRQLREKFLEIVEANNKQSDPEVDVYSLRKEMADALTEGRTDDAIRVQEQLEAFQHKQLEAEMARRLKEIEKTVTQDVTQKYEATTFNKALKQTLDAHPEFDPDSTKYDAQLTQDVADLMEGYHASGKYSKSEALEKAVSMRVINKPTLDFEDRGKEQKKINIEESQNKAPELKTESNKAHLDVEVLDIDKLSQKQVDEILDDPELFKKYSGGLG